MRSRALLLFVAVAAFVLLTGASGYIRYPGSGAGSFDPSVSRVITGTWGFSKPVVLDAGATLNGSLNGQDAGFNAVALTGPATSAVASGANAFAVSTNGARYDFGTGASDYLFSDGTRVLSAGQLGVANGSGLLFDPGNVAVRMNSSVVGALELIAAPVQIQSPGFFYSLNGLVTCSSTFQGLTVSDIGAGTSTGHPTRQCLCRSDGAAGYAWQNLTTGAVGTTTTCPDGSLVRDVTHATSFGLGVAGGTAIAQWTAAVAGTAKTCSFTSQGAAGVGTNEVFSFVDTTSAATLCTLTVGCASASGTVTATTCSGTWAAADVLQWQLTTACATTTDQGNLIHSGVE